MWQQNSRAEEMQNMLLLWCTTELGIGAKFSTNATMCPWMLTYNQHEPSFCIHKKVSHHLTCAMTTLPTIGRNKKNHNIVLVWASSQNKNLDVDLSKAKTLKWFTRIFGHEIRHLKLKWFVFEAMAQLSGSKMFNALALGAKALLVILPVTPKYFYSICYLEQQKNDRIHVGHNVQCSVVSIISTCWEGITVGNDKFTPSHSVEHWHLHK